MKQLNIYTRFGTLVIVLALALYSCKKGGDDSGNSSNTPVTPPKTVVVPTVTVSATSSTGHDAGASGGYVLADGGATVTAAGVCWSTAQNPSIANNKTNDATGLGAYSSVLTGLSVNVTYYVRAYATNSAGTAYSTQVSFTTAFRIGEAYQGGIIFSIDATNLHGLIRTVNDQGYVTWGTGLAGAYDNFNGVANTAKIVQVLGSNGKAVAICKACRDGGYSDWYLPSIVELQTLYGSSSSGLSQGNYYWSSTESNINSAAAYVVTFPYGNPYAEVKSIAHNVHPIRAF